MSLIIPSVECGTCGGGGQRMGDRAGGMYPCSVCNGSGRVIAPEAVERAAKALFDYSGRWPDEDWATIPKVLREDRIREMRVALRAAVSTEDEQ